MHTYEKIFIGGSWVAPTSDATIEVVSPHTEEIIGVVPAGGTRDIDAAVAHARHAFASGVWSDAEPTERVAAVQRLADLYATRMGDMAALITDEMGSPITFSNVAQAAGPWIMLNQFCEIASEHPWEETRAGIRGPVVVRSEPVGVVGAIVPWNVPQFTTISKLAPALLAGCSIVVKPSPETPLDANLLAELIAAAGIPEGVVSIVPGGREVGEHLVSHPDVDKVAFTGSTAAGRTIASICGQQLKAVTLELGGKSAAIVLDDADLDTTMAGLKTAALLNSGQGCVCQTRILVSRRRYGEVVDALAETVSAMKVGDPRDVTTEIGPMVTRRQQERVERYIALGQAEGARLVVGGTGMPDGIDRGWYVRPTVFADVDNAMRIAQEEIFGPVLVVIPYEDERDAIAIANASDYGLAGSVWTNDNDRGMEIARRVRTGTYAINQYITDLSAPFGGYKASGLGREFGPEGFAHYLEKKSIVPAQQ